MLVKRRKQNRYECRWPDPVWDLSRDGVSQSLLRVFRTCRHQTYLKFIEGWTGRKETVALAFGSCVHYCLSYLYSLPKSKAWPVDDALDRYQSVWEKDNPMVSGATAAQQEMILAQADVVIRAYLRRYASDWKSVKTSKDGTISPRKWLHLENEFIFPIQTSRGVVKMRGCFDGVFEDFNGGVWLLETKTKSLIDEDGIADSLSLDLQVNLYLTALKSMYGSSVRGVLYNVIRRPGLRQGKHEKDSDFLNRIASDLADPKRQDHYFKRWEAEPTKKELNVWKETQLIPMLEDLVDWYTGKGAHYLNEDALQSKYGRADLYNLIVHGASVDHYQRTSAFRELEDI